MYIVKCLCNVIKEVPAQTNLLGICNAWNVVRPAALTKRKDLGYNEQLLKDSFECTLQVCAAQTFSQSWFEYFVLCAAKTDAPPQDLKASTIEASVKRTWSQLSKCSREKSLNPGIITSIMQACVLC